MSRALRPVGEPISTQQSSQEISTFFNPFKTHLYASGTAALAAAVGAALQHRPTQQPEVLLPAYGCPSLVSAIIFNQAKPVLVDLAKNKIELDSDDLATKLTENTVAVISVDLFGLPSVSNSHRQLLRQHNCTLIRDCAQARVLPTTITSDDSELIVISFGRGKPVSVLTGGAVLQPPNQPFKLPHLAAVTDTFASNLLTRLKLEVYNLAIKPSIYGFLEHLPIGLGETRYSQLEEIGGMPKPAIRYLLTNLNRASTVDGSALRQDYENLFSPKTSQGWIDLCQQSDPKRTHHLLRYAVLAPSKAIRDKVLATAQNQKLGFTALYGQPIPHIAGIPPIVGKPDHSAHPNATELAERLLTLPFYRGISATDLQQFSQAISLL